MSRTKRRVVKKPDGVFVERDEGMWIAPAAAVEAAELAYAEATVGKIMSALDAFLDELAKAAAITEGRA